MALDVDDFLFEQAGRIAGCASYDVALSELRTHAAMSALWPEVEEAEAAIRAMMELRGEEPPEPSEAVVLASAGITALEARKRDPALVRVRSWVDYLMGGFWLALGGAQRAIARFERAAGRRPRWAAPLARVAPSALSRS